MKSTVLLTLAFCAATTVLAQAPAQPSPSGNARPPAETNPNASGGKAQAAGERNVDRRKMMDTNGDGKISRAEWDAYHAKMWTSMKPDSGGMVQWDSVETGMGWSQQGGTPK